MITNDENVSSETFTSSFRSIIITSFTTVFFAELGDKTQLATLLLSAQSGRPLIVFIGASLALISCSLVGVLIGRWLANILRPEIIERTAGILMIALGFWLGVKASISLLIK